MTFAQEFEALMAKHQIKAFLFAGIADEKDALVVIPKNPGTFVSLLDAVVTYAKQTSTDGVQDATP